jgi:hypothetical protein
MTRKLPADQALHTQHTVYTSSVVLHGRSENISRTSQTTIVSVDVQLVLARALLIDSCSPELSGFVGLCSFDPQSAEPAATGHPLECTVPVTPLSCLPALLLFASPVKP